jgi:hypothetical protein
MSALNAIVWVDHREALIASFSLGSSQTFEIHSHSPQRRIHRKAPEIGSGGAANDHDFFDEIAWSLTDVREVQIAPGNARTASET